MAFSLTGCGASPPASRVVTTAPAPARWPVDPRLAADNTYLNVAPGVRYVGDAACTPCHRRIAETYREHPMGQSLFPIAEAPAIERFDAASHNPFDAAGFRFAVERQDHHMRHTATRADNHGTVVAQLAVEVQYVLGSGRRGRSYVIERDGFLNQSPVSWYAQAQRWDLAPGYANETPHIDRQITAECLFCHGNQAEPVPQTMNRYKQPVFRGYAIGCERCHGPGEVHVQAAENKTALDRTIVNPRHLEPHLREGVCQQCHLQGVMRVERLGREVFDYRPGLPLHEFWSIFVPAAAAASEQNGTGKREATNSGELDRAVGHVEQMYSSRCFKASSGRFGCISCHDPHQAPPAAGRDAYYRHRCLKCHAESACTAPPAERQATRPGDSCIQCHMKPAGSGEIIHTALTDHRIRRPIRSRSELAAGQGQVERPGPRNTEAGVYVPSDVVLFHRDLLAPADLPIVDRDLAVLMSSRTVPALLEALAGSAQGIQRSRATMPKLDAALANWPDDLAALEGKASALWLQNRTDEAAAVLEAVLTRAPEREMALDLAGTLALQTNRLDAAAAYWQRATKVNPQRWRFHFLLAETYKRSKAWSAALPACQRALELHPASVYTRVLLLMIYVGLGDQSHAQKEFDLLMALNPPEAADIRRWYEGRKGGKN